MIQVLKYTLPTSYGWHDIEMPSNAESIGVHVQDNKPVVYVVGDLNDMKTIRVYCAGTGMDIPTTDITAVLGSAVLDGGEFVTHYFI